jgi:hypothetical protein
MKVSFRSDLHATLMHSMKFTMAPSNSSLITRSTVVPCTQVARGSEGQTPGGFMAGRQGHVLPGRFLAHIIMSRTCRKHGNDLGAGKV